MSEINGPKINLNQVSYSNLKQKAHETEQPAEEFEPKITDFSDNKAEALGRSMLFKGKDDINNDLKALVDNPSIAEKSDEVFEAAYQVAQDEEIENPYEEAASVSTAAM